MWAMTVALLLEHFSHVIRLHNTGNPDHPDRTLPAAPCPPRAGIRSLPASGGAAGPVVRLPSGGAGSMGLGSPDAPAVPNAGERVQYPGESASPDPGVDRLRRHHLAAAPKDSQEPRG